MKLFAMRPWAAKPCPKQVHGRGPEALVAALRSRPWIGWGLWGLFVTAVLLRMHPRRFGAAFQYYLDFAEKLWTGQTVYDPSVLGDVAYAPTSLLMFVPLTPPMNSTWAGVVALTLFAALFTFAAVTLTRAMLVGRAEALALAGLVLVINIPAAWYHFKQVQLHIPMTAAMMLAAGAIAARSVQTASLWLVGAVLLKLTALPMVLLGGALLPRGRLLIAAGLLAGAALPFAFLPAEYLIQQYRLFGLKLWAVATAPAADWPYQADISTLLRGIGVTLPGPAGLALRLAAALGTLALAWRVQRDGGARAFALGLLLLSGLYITLFGPRNENVSFLVLTPSLAMLAVLMLLRSTADARGWLLVLACVALGFVVSPDVDAITKPAIVSAIYAWAVRQMLTGRWRSLVEDPVP